VEITLTTTIRLVIVDVSVDSLLSIHGLLTEDVGVIHKEDGLEDSFDSFNVEELIIDNQNLGFNFLRAIIL
jgi:hypothetical protein